MNLKKILLIAVLFSVIFLAASCNIKKNISNNDGNSAAATQATSISGETPTSTREAVAPDEAALNITAAPASSNIDKGDIPEKAQNTPNPSDKQAAAPSTSEQQAAAPSTSEQQAAAPSTSEQQAAAPSPPEQEIPEAVSKKVLIKAEAVAKNDNVETDDYLAIAKILVGKLSMKEIKYLFDTAKKDYWETTPVEDIEKAREILFSKLSDDDIVQLMGVGKKWGRSMDILKKDLDVAATKEKQMKSVGLIE